MTTKKPRKTNQKIKTLATKTVSAKKAGQVKGGGKPKRDPIDFC
jgi:hypothetical protein